MQVAQHTSPIKATTEISDLPPGFSSPNIVQLLENVSSRIPGATVVPPSTAVSTYPERPVSELGEGSIPPGFEKMAAILATKEKNVKGMCSVYFCINKLDFPTICQVKCLFIYREFTYSACGDDA